MISTDNIVLAVAFKIVLWYNVRNKNESVFGCVGY